MANYSESIENDIKRRSKTFGIALGIACLPFALVAGALGGCCPLGSFLGVMPVALAGGLAGTLAAMFLNWGQIPFEAAIGVGAKVGARTAMIASAIGALCTFLLSLLSAGALGAAAAESSGQGAGQTVLASAFLNAIVLALGIIPGVVLGVVGGVIGAAVKRPASGSK